MKDRSDDPSHHERTLLPRSYISLPMKNRDCLTEIPDQLQREDFNVNTNTPLSCDKVELISPPHDKPSHVVLQTDTVVTAAAAS